MRGSRGGILAGVPDAVWTTPTFLVRPAMIIEDLHLGRALRRATYIVESSLRLVAVAKIGVSAVVGVLMFMAIVHSIFLGGGASCLAEAVLDSSTGSLLFGGVLGMTVATVGIAIVAALSRYVTSAYPPRLFFWAMHVERA